MSAFTDPNTVFGIGNIANKWRGVGARGIKIEGYILVSTSGEGRIGDINTVYPQWPQ